MNKLKYLGYSIVFQEVPNEVSLAINISGCPHKCEGCHSQYLWEYVGNYLSDDLENLIKKYDGLITCVCFMGGDQNLYELIQCFKLVKSYNLKTCLYSGLDVMPKHIHTELIDYIKIGRYDYRLGGLSSPTTNQRFFKLTAGSDETTIITDLTSLFQRRSNEQ